jgi:hypothetical protein
VTTIPEGYVVITSGEVYREVLATKDAVHSLTARFDAIVGHLPETIKDQETRIRHLEMRVWMAAGVVALIISAASVCVPLFT